MAKIIEIEVNCVISCAVSLTIDPEKWAYPVGPLNRELWSEQISLEDKRHRKIITSPERSPDERYMLVDLTQADLDKIEQSTEISWDLTAYDKRIYIAIYNLYMQGHQDMSFHRIYQALNPGKEPCVADIDKISDTVIKLAQTFIKIDITNDYPKYKSKAGRLKFFEPLLNIDFGFEFEYESEDRSVKVGGIRVLKMPITIRIERERNQCATIPAEAMRPPFRMTKPRVAIEGYLLDRVLHITRAKSKTNPKILYKTVIKNCFGTANRMETKRMKESISKFMEHYKSQGIIASYELLPDGVRVSKG